MNGATTPWLPAGALRRWTVPSTLPRRITAAGALKSSSAVRKYTAVMPSSSAAVVACGAGPPVGSVRPRIDPVKRNTFLPAESPGRFACWGHRQWQAAVDARALVPSPGRDGGVTRCP